MSGDGLEASTSGSCLEELTKVGEEGDREGGAMRRELRTYIRVIKGFVSYCYVFPLYGSQK